jgi:hypothetical protein
MATAAINALSYNALGAKGYTGTLNERMLAYLQASGATSDNLPTAWQQVLVGLGYSDNINESLYKFLGAAPRSYTGTINERLYKWWTAGGDFV